MAGRRGREGASRAIIVPVGRALRRPGVQFPLQRRVTVDELRVGDAVLAAGAEVTIDGVMEATGDSIVVSGTVGAEADCACRRCLERFACPVEAEVKEIFEPRPTEGETYPLRGEDIDLEPLVRDALLLSLPLAPLCRPDCPGPDPDGQPLAGDGAFEDPASDDGPPADEEVAAPVDPRWAALSQLRLDR